MTSETAIQKSAQKMDGTPVSISMFFASVAASVETERKKRSRRPKTASRTHCTARKLTRKLRARGPALVDEGDEELEGVGEHPRVGDEPEREAQGGRGHEGLRLRARVTCDLESH